MATVIFNPEEETRGTFAEIHFSDPQFMNLMRVAYGLEEGVTISSFEIRPDGIRAVLQYERDEEEP